MTTLKDRCNDFVSEQLGLTFEPLSRASLQATGDKIEAFVLSEIGRAASDKLSESNALVLFFASREGADTVLAAIEEAQPGLVERSWP